VIFVSEDGSRAALLARCSRALPSRQRRARGARRNAFLVRRLLHDSTPVSPGMRLCCACLTPSTAQHVPLACSLLPGHAACMTARLAISPLVGFSLQQALLFLHFPILQQANQQLVAWGIPAAGGSSRTATALHTAARPTPATRACRAALRWHFCCAPALLLLPRWRWRVHRLLVRAPFCYIGDSCVRGVAQGIAAVYGLFPGISIMRDVCLAVAGSDIMRWRLPYAH